MIRNEVNEENTEITNKAYERLGKHGFRDANAFVDRLEAERQTGNRSRRKLTKQMHHILIAVMGLEFYESSW